MSTSKSAPEKWRCTICKEEKVGYKFPLHMAFRTGEKDWGNYPNPYEEFGLICKECLPTAGSSAHLPRVECPLKCGDKDCKKGFRFLRELYIHIRRRVDSHPHPYAKALTEEAFAPILKAKQADDKAGTPSKPAHAANAAAPGEFGEAGEPKKPEAKAPEPATAEPATAESATAESATAEPATAEPATAEPATAEPATPEPKATTRSAAAMEAIIPEPCGYFPLSLCGVTGAMSTPKYQKALASYLRDGAISRRLEATLEAYPDGDSYTRVASTTLVTILTNYSVGIEDLEPELKKVFVPRTESGPERSLLEVDHVWDVQLWAKAVDITNSRTPEDGKSSFTISFAQILFLYQLINDTSNLNVTPWRVNSVAKNKLITKFLGKYSFGSKVNSPETWSYNALLATGEVSKPTQDILNVPTTSGIRVGHRIGRRMLEVLDDVIAPALRLEKGTAGASGTWSDEEKKFFLELLTVLTDMCNRLWREVKAAMELELADMEANK
jgi:hypothetical protein